MRSIAAIILAFFTWFSIEPWNYAIAAQGPPKPQASTSSKPKTAPEKFEESLHAAKQIIEDLDQQVAQGQDITLSLESLKGHRQVIEAADAEIRAEFSSTEAKLKAANLPTEILQRHQKAVADYEQNFQKLKENLQAIEQLEQERIQAEDRKDQATAKAKQDQLKQRIKGANTHLQDKVKEPPHTPLDPNNLPHRTPKVKERKPRLKKEEFTEFQQPIRLAFNGDPSTLLVAKSTQDLPKPEDLAETIEVQFTQEIKDLAAQLEHNPVKIYNYVRNNIDFVPTYGSIQGAHMCLLTKQCNDMDTASLLIALLRTSGIAARYVTGTIEVPIDQVMNWVGGFTDARSALNFIASGGTPVTGLISGGKFVAARMEHVWVEAYVDYIPSRGAVYKQGDTWIPLDASFKQFSLIPGVNLQQAVPFDAQAFVNQLQSTATIDEQQGFVSNVDSAFMQTTLTDLQSRLQDYLNTNFPNATVEDVIGKKAIKVQEFPRLAGTLPYKTVVTASKLSVLPDSLRHKLTFEVITDAFFGVDLTFTASLPELIGKRVTLSYIPATTADQQTADQFGGLYQTPSYLIKVKPQLKVDGIAKSEGVAVGMGAAQKFTMTFSLPNQGPDQVKNWTAPLGLDGLG